MAALRQAHLNKIASISQQIIRNFHSNSVLCDVKWREQRKLSINPNGFGPLTNLPDYSFKDGRPVPYGTNQKRRIDEQRENLKRIKMLVTEIDNAVINHEKRLRQVEEEKQRIIGRKLKEKGSKLLADVSKRPKISDGVRKSEKKDVKVLTADSKEDL